MALDVYGLPIPPVITILRRGVAGQPYPLAVDRSTGELHAWNDGGRSLCGLEVELVNYEAPPPRHAGLRIRSFDPSSSAACHGCAARIPPAHR